MLTNLLRHKPMDDPDGVVATEDEVVALKPLPANKCTHSKPLTPVPTSAGLSILYFKNSEN